MLKKILIASGVVILILLVGGFFWVRSVLAGDGVKNAIAAQMTTALGQPVVIGRISASAFPRVTVKLGDVRIGNPVQIQVSDLDIGTDFRALLSRRIEHASLRLNGAQIDLPLPPFPGLSSNSSGASSGSPVELVSIDEITLNDVRISSGGRTLKGDVELEPHGQAITIRKVKLAADGATITATGQISNMAGPVGDIKLTATTLDFDQLRAFATDFSGAAGLPASSSAPPAPSRAPQPASVPGAPVMNLTVSLVADRATMGGLSLEKLSGRAQMTAAGIALDPLSFKVFGGQYNGSLTLSPDAVPDVSVKATLAGVNVADATRFAGSPDTISGQLSGHLEFRGRGADAATLTNSARGTLRIDVTDGVVKNLGLVHAVVIASSMRSGSTQAAASGSKDERFTKLGATLNLSNGVVTTNDLSFDSVDLNLAASGLLRLSAATVDLQGKLQLSDALSKQAGQDLVRYTQEQGRVTLPASITGPASAPSVKVDVGAMAKRAVTNAAKEEANKRLKGGLSGLLGR